MPTQPVQSGFVAWSQTSLAQPAGGASRRLAQSGATLPWYATFNGDNNAIFGGQFVETSLNNTATSVALTGSGVQEATSMIVSNNGQPFSTYGLCVSSPGAFSLAYSFSLSAAPPTMNTLSDGLTLSFVDASATSAGSVAWAADAANVLVPLAYAVSLEVDTHDGACPRN